MLFLIVFLGLINVAITKNNIINKTKLSSQELWNLEDMAGGAVSKTLIRAGGFRVFPKSLNELDIRAIDGNMLLLQCPDIQTNETITWTINGEQFTRKQASWRRYLIGNDLALFPADSNEDYGIFECYAGEEIIGQGTLFVETQIHAIGEGFAHYCLVGCGVLLTQIIGLAFYLLYLNFIAKVTEKDNKKVAVIEQNNDEEEDVSEAENDDDEQTEEPQQKQ
uniref:Ig-like domain-containing protein n=1 Tax=Panagrolaimus sp. ES5 TaxID=591445 RepID=A0AC34FDQ0_9BILA